MKKAGVHLNAETNKKNLKPNDKCSCNSGKKYKKCCMNTQQVSGLAGDQKITFTK